jgi:DNA-binding transcriptional LysR family regulator
VVEGASDLRSLRSGLLRVVAPQMLSCTWISTVLGEFAAAHPDVGLRVTDATTDDVVGVVRRGEAELGVGPERSVGDDVIRSFLMDVPIRMVCPARHPLAGRRVVSWDELRDERWVIYSSEFNRQLEHILQTHDSSLSMQTAVEVGYLTTALAMVGVGAGLAAVPDYARLFADNFKLRFVPLRAPEIRRQFYIYQRRGMALSPAAQAFVALMQRHAARALDKA